MAAAIELLAMQRYRKKKAISRSRSLPEEEVREKTISKSRSLSEKEEVRKKVISGSRSLPPEEVEKTVYLCVNSWFHEQTGTTTDWYVIKLSSKHCSSTQTTQRKKRKKKTGRVVLGSRERRRSILQPCTTSAAAANAGSEKLQLHIKPIPRNTQLSQCDGNGFVALGSTIYCTSATDADSCGVLAWDTTTMPRQQQWERFPSMNIERRNRYSEAVTADDGKIYVFGGFHPYETINELFLCEVFDPTMNKWKPINPPPPNMPRLHFIFSVYDDTSRRIILGSRSGNSFIAYHLSDATWEILPQKFLHSLDIHISRPAFFDNTIYWIQIVEDNISRCGLCAYDLDLGVIIHGPIIGLHPYFWGSSCMSTMQFLHFRGDEFYLIWLQVKTNLLRCERMRVSKQQSSLNCYVISTETYILDTELSEIGEIRAVVL